MAKPRERHGAFLCLSAAFLALLTPMAFLLHTGYFGTHSPLCGTGVPGLASTEYLTVHERAHRGAAHDSADCMTCQALLHYVSGVTLGHAHEVSVPTDFTIHGCVAVAISPYESCFSPFFSRAPPRFSVSVRS